MEISDLKTQPDTSFSMLAAAAGGDQQAWRRMTELYAPLIAHWARSRNLPENELPDLVQSVFVDLIMSVEQHDRERPFRDWLWDITRKRALEIHRQSDQTGTQGSVGDSLRDWSSDADEEPEGALKFGIQHESQRMEAEFQSKTARMFERRAPTRLDEHRANMETRQSGIAVDAGVRLFEAINRSVDSSDRSMVLKLFGKRLGKYDICGVLGSGGMGIVFRARHVFLHRDVALKVIRPLTPQQRELTTRFFREMRAIGNLDHQHIVRAMDAGESDGLFFLAMELIEGINLRDLLLKGRLTSTVACEIARQTACGLCHIHHSGLLHRDIKPSNLMLTSSDDGRLLVKLLDLGLVRNQDHGFNHSTTQVGQIVGTPGYLAPEAVQDWGQSDRACDLYALGVTLHEMVAGRLPHGTFTVNRELHSDLPSGVADIIDLAIAKSPEQRFQSSDEFAAALQPYSLPTQYPPPIINHEPSAHAPPPHRRRWQSVPNFATAAGIACLAMVLVGTIGFLVPWSSSSETDRPTLVRAEADSQPSSASSGIDSPHSVLIETPPSRASEYRVLEAPPSRTQGRSGYQAENYHPLVPSDRTIEVDFRGHPYDEETVNFYFEATPGRYTFRVRPDNRGFLDSDFVVLHFYQDGDSGHIDPTTGAIVSEPLEVVRTPAKAEIQFDVRPGTQKISVAPATENDGQVTRIPNSHTVCTTYCYPDLTYADASIGQKLIYAGGSFDVRFSVHNVGNIPSLPGETYIFLDPLAGKSRSVFRRIPFKALQPNERQHFQTTIEISRFQKDAEFQVRILVDATDTTCERDELPHGAWRQNLGKAFVPSQDLEHLVPYNNEASFELKVRAVEP